MELIMAKSNPLSSLIKSLTKDKTLKILSGPLQGYKWQTNAGNNAYWVGSYEKDYVKVFCEEVKPGHTVFDIGAQGGYYSLIASRLTGEKGHVFAFEPLPTNANFIREHLQINQCTNVTLLEIALAFESGVRGFQSSNAFMGHIAKNGSIQVEVRTIDELVAEKKITPPQVIKIDVEGSEYWVLKGGEKVLKEFKPIIFIATHGIDNRDRTLALLQEWGYEFKLIQGSERNADYFAKFPENSHI